MDKKSFLLGTLTGVMTRGQILSHATRIFNEDPKPKCARIPRFSEGFNWGSPTARIFGVAKTECERAFTMLSHDKNNLW